MININNLLSTDTNIIEIYFLNADDKNKTSYKKNIYLSFFSTSSIFLTSYYIKNNFLNDRGGEL